MKRWILALGLALGCGGRKDQDQATAWSPPAGLTQIAIWPGAAPDPQPVAAPERLRPTSNQVAGRPWTAIENVATPTMTVYPAKGKNTGAAMVVFPGGGYEVLAIDLEGTEICDWITSKGVTCVVLKYRVPWSGPHWDKACDCHVPPAAPIALEDAQRTISLVRSRAAEWGIDPHKVGVIGFSAGGHLAADVSTHFATRAYAAIDAVDDESCRPDFAIVMYPGHLWKDDSDLELEPEIATHITAETSPTFLLQSEDDPVDDVNHSLVYYRALRTAGVDVEMHLYPHGGHAFGLRPTEAPITRWPALVETWLASLEILP